MDKTRVLVVDDEESMRNFMEIMLFKEGYEVECASSGEEAIAKIRKAAPNVIIADLMMPEMTGLELLSKVKRMDEDIPFIVMTAFASVDSAIEAMKSGAYDYITKPFKIDEVKLALSKLSKEALISEENKDLKTRLSTEFSFDNFIGQNPRVLKMKEMALTVANSDSTVLVRGESGTGKDLIAKAMHYHSNRAGKPFITINCAALPETLLESELFGHVKGSFTGAFKDKDGLFKVADTGTFFLDEIGTTSHSIQAKLLRALEEKIITPVGSTTPIKVDVRLIAATNADLETEVEANRFRADLFYRLNVLPIYIPSLRERREDIELLVNHFVRIYSEKMKLPIRKVSGEALSALVAYDWPGNVRELENSVERALLLSKSDEIVIVDFPKNITEQVPKTAIDPRDKATTPTLESIEKAYIFWTLNQTGWQKSRAAKILGIDPSTLYRKIDRYDLRHAEKGDS
ncbi:MAG: sigma-54 dependent transcriptional regulator [candidate division Zixibacteria bacterium]|nr:sigma-54 dependent transcriptional regulator [candidate division Zixibacteria bacterium]MBU1471873.1 sigma-54 dependent transcriptional regulator [candidate division Zixibacteria bacterium]